MSAFLVNLTVANKQVFSVKVLVRSRDQLFNPLTMCKFKMKLLYNDEQLFCTKTELLNFKVTLALAELYMVGSRLVSKCSIFSDDIGIDIQLTTFLLLSNNIELLSFGAKTKKF